MIILDTDGIIVFVAENITYLLGYTPVSSLSFRGNRAFWLVCSFWGSFSL
jgi:hypothetical protein